MVPLKYLSNFWRSLEIANCVIVYADVANQNATFEIKDTKLYVLVVTFSTQYDYKLLQQLKSGFKRTISWNKYLSKPELLKKQKLKSFS